MTTPEHPDDELDDGSAIAVRVRATLAAVAEQTEVVPRPVSDGRGATGDGAPGSTPVRLVDDYLLVRHEDVDERTPRRRWQVLAAAAALVVVLVGVVAVAFDRGTVTTAPVADPADDGAASFTDSKLVGPPRQALGVELRSISVLPWRTGERSSDEQVVPGMPDEIVHVATPDGSEVGIPLAFPTQDVASAGVAIWYLYGPDAASATSAQPPLRLTVRTGVTLDPTTLASFGGGTPVPALDGVVLDLGDVCSTSGQVGGSPLAPPPSTSDGSLSCRAVTLVSTDDQIVVIDADRGTPLDDVVADLQLESLDQLDARLDGVPNSGWIRWSLAALDYLPESTVPTTPSTTAPRTLDADLCGMWGLVRNHLAQDDPNATEVDAGLGEDLMGLQAAAPPELRGDVDRLLQQSAVAPAPPERADTVARLGAVLDPGCGFGS